MARDRRRAKQRRDRQARAGGPQARSSEGRATPAPGAPAPTGERDAEHVHDHEAPELANGEIDLAEAQLEVGRPDLADVVEPGPDDLAGAAGEAEIEDEAAFEALEDRVDEAEEAFEEGRTDNGHDEEGGAEVARRRGGAPASAERAEGNRVAIFLRGSWRELQRVQWPDRRQVGQATAVTIGFVVIAGAFLGLMDFVASKIVEFIV